MYCNGPSAKTQGMYPKPSLGFLREPLTGVQDLDGKLSVGGCRSLLGRKESPLGLQLAMPLRWISLGGARSQPEHSIPGLQMSVLDFNYAAGGWAFLQAPPADMQWHMANLRWMRCNLGRDGVYDRRTAATQNMEALLPCFFLGDLKHAALIPYYTTLYCTILY